MPAGGESLIAGQYVTNFGGIDMGIMEGDAGVPTIEYTPEGEDIGNTDKYGRAVIDTILLGQNCFAQYMCMEYDAGSIQAFWPWGDLGIMGTIARLGFDLADALILTAIAGTPAESSPATLTAPKALLAMGYNTRLLFGPPLRKVPIRQRLYPANLGGSVGHFTAT